MQAAAVYSDVSVLSAGYTVGDLTESVNQRPYIYMNRWQLSFQLRTTPTRYTGPLCKVINSAKNGIYALPGICPFVCLLARLLKNLTILMNFFRRDVACD